VVIAMMVMSSQTDEFVADKFRCLLDIDFHGEAKVYDFNRWLGLGQIRFGSWSVPLLVKDPIDLESQISD
jgi:hypothetical protein